MQTHRVERRGTIALDERLQLLVGNLRQRILAAQSRSL